MGGREDENINVVPTQSIIGQGVPNYARMPWTRIENTGSGQRQGDELEETIGWYRPRYPQRHQFCSEIPGRVVKRVFANGG